VAVTKFEQQAYLLDQMAMKIQQMDRLLPAHLLARFVAVVRSLTSRMRGKVPWTVRRLGGSRRWARADAQWLRAEKSSSIGK